MDNQESLRQHRKKRLMPLHPNRVPRRNDSNTFFASIKYIRGYKFVQLLYSLLSCYTYICCMRRESHSHKAYQDFIRNIGAPVKLLTDNAKTLIGKKWTKTSRDNITKQRQIASHNQQHNQSEGRLRKVKTCTLLVMRKSNAPFIFWCYCFQFVVDCMNHSSVKSLDWNTCGEAPQQNARHFHVLIRILGPCVVLRTHSQVPGAKLSPSTTPRHRL